MLINGLWGVVTSSDECGRWELEEGFRDAVEQRTEMEHDGKAGQAEGYQALEEKLQHLGKLVDDAENASEAPSVRCVQSMR